MARNVHENYVRMGKHLCVVCAKEHESGEILIHKRLQEIPEGKTLTGWGMCPECKRLEDDGYIALVEIDPQKSNAKTASKVKQNDAYRTGRIMHIRKAVADELFNVPITTPMVWIDPELWSRLEFMMPKSEAES